LGALSNICFLRASPTAPLFPIQLPYWGSCLEKTCSNSSPISSPLIGDHQKRPQLPPNREGDVAPPNTRPHPNCRRFSSRACMDLLLRRAVVAPSGLELAP
jgi:hypothetical protein